MSGSTFSSSVVDFPPSQPEPVPQSVLFEKELTKVIYISIVVK